MNSKKRKKIRKLAAYLSLVTVILFIITGYGITHYQLVEKISFGLLTKNLSFQIHLLLIYPFIVFLGIHLYFSCSLFNCKRKK